MSKNFLELLKEKVVVFDSKKISVYLFEIVHKFRLLVLMVSLFLFTGCFPNDEQHKKDNELIENFNQHKEQFNQILQIMQENCDVTQNPEKKMKLINEKSAKYKKLSEEIGFSDETFGNCLKDGVEFVDSVQGLAVSGSSKGFAFFE